jgi:filamentous hemagglutinin family protein
MMKPTWSLFFTTLSLAILGSLAPICSATAQIVEDSSLDATGRTSITRDVLIRNIISDRIDGGTTSGSNLFHSFEEFNVGAGRGVYFSNPAGIENILTRITGGNPSNIRGTLGVVDINNNLGTANLFLINPNGIIFGPNARLDLGGSFFGSTANSIVFDNGFEFSATNPQAPLLTVNIPVGLRFRDNPGNITTERSVVGDSVFSSFLSVQPEKTLALVGGNVSLDGGILFAPGGRIELGGLSTAGTVGINADGSLNFPDGVARGDVFFTNNAIASVAGAGGGDIAVNTRNFYLQGSGLYAGIQAGLGTPDTQAGDIVINAIDNLRIEGDANSTTEISNLVGSSALGNAGNVVINTKALEGIGKFAIGSSTFGQGNAGKVSITATDRVSLQGLQGFGSGIGSVVGASAVGNADEIFIDTRSLSLSNFAQLVTSTTGKGNAGNIRIKASESISVSNNSNLQAITYSSGNAGNIIIDAENATVFFDGIGSRVGTSVAGRTTAFGTDLVGSGQGGNIKIKARSLTLTNGAQFFTTTFGVAGDNGPANAGNIELNISDSVNLKGSSLLLSRSNGEGNAGNINITTGSLFVSDGSQLNSNTFGKGDAGSITINATDTVFFDGTDNQGLPSAAFSTIEAGGEGKGGDISITARSLSLTNGGELNTFVREGGIGNAGNVKLNISDTIKIAGVSDKPSSNGIFAGSGIFSSVGSGSTGNAGNIEIVTGSLFVSGGGQLFASTSGKGDAGNITINATDTVSFDGVDKIYRVPSAAFSTIEAGGEGKGGDISITARSLSLTNGGELNTFVREGGIGNAGNVKLNISDTIKIAGVSDKPSSNGIFARSGVFSSVESGAIGNAGNIEIATGSLFVSDGGQLFASTRGKGDAGNITINATDTVSFDGTDNILEFPSAAFSTIEAGGDGKGGDIYITARSLSLTNGGQLNTFVREATNTAPGGIGDAGNVKLNISDTIKIAGISDKPQPNGIFNRAAIFSSVERGAKGNAGDIEISTGSLFMSDGGLLFASTFGDGDAGKIKINARSLSLKNGAQISTNSNVENRQAGDIEITTAKDIRLDNQASITAQTKGGQGNIILRSRDLIMRRNSNISTNATGTATGGNIDITTGNLVALENSDISARAEESFGGRIIITADSIFGTQFREDFTPESDIIASSQLGPQFSGTVQINTPEVDPSKGLVELPETVVDPQDQIAQNPCQKIGGSEFIITGRGGLPPSPNQNFSSNNVRVDLVNPAISSGNFQSATINQPTISSTTKQVVPAQGWVFNDKGDVVLTAYDPTVAHLPQRASSKATAACPAPF